MHAFATYFGRASSGSAEGVLAHDSNHSRDNETQCTSGTKLKEKDVGENHEEKDGETGLKGGEVVMLRKL